MSELGRFLGGAALGLFLAIVIVTAFNGQSYASRTAMSSKPSSAGGQAPVFQTGNPSGASNDMGLSAAGLTETFPAVAIALVLGLMVYQLSIRRAESG